MTPEESALAQQLPEEWVLEHALTQEQVGNAVPLGLTFHLGVKIASYLHPLLLAREEEGGGATASQRCAPPLAEEEKVSFVASVPSAARSQARGWQSLPTRAADDWFQSQGGEAGQVEALVLAAEALS